jgi:hypothetical protein
MALPSGGPAVAVAVCGSPDDAGGGVRGGYGAASTGSDNSERRTFAVA